MKTSAILLAVVCLIGGTAAAQGELALVRARDSRGAAIDPDQYRGRVVVLTFASRYTEKEVSRVNDRLAGHSGGGDVVVLSVIDFQGIPSMFYGYARKRIAESDQPGRIQHLVDEHGELRQRFATDPRRRVDILVIDRDGGLRGRFVGERDLDAALRLVDEVKVQRAAM